jgi:protein-serine/threonine kinase
MNSQRRPLPATPPGVPYNYPNSSGPSPYFFPHTYLPFIPRTMYDPFEEPTTATTLRGGTLLHKGFYDLLSMIPTPSSSRFFWGTPAPEPVVAGPRYEDISPRTRNAGPPQPLASPPTPLSLKKGRRISKDMVSKPTGFVYVET